MSRIRLASVLAFVCLLAPLPVPAAAWDNPNFVTPRSATDDATGPDVAVDDAGRALATWMQTSTPGDLTQWRVRAASLAAGASAWSQLSPLSPLGARPGNTALGVAGGGAAVAAWTEGGNGVLKAARGSTTTSAFGDPVTFGGFGCPNQNSAVDDRAVGPTVALGDGGSGHIAWTSPCGDTDNGRWVLFRQITNDGFATTTKSAGHNRRDALLGPIGPQLAIDPASGGSRAVFKEAQFPAPLVARDLMGNDTVGSQQSLVADSNAFQERIGFLSDGKQVTVYRTGEAIRALIDGTNTRLNPEGQAGLDPQLAVSADGTVVAAWYGDDGYWAAVRHPTAMTWGPAHRISEDEGEPRDLDLAISDEGTAYAVWRRDPGDLFNVEAAILDPDDPTRSPGTPYQFQPVADTVFEAGHESLDGGSFSGDAATPKVAVTPQGNAVVVFKFIVEVGVPGRYGIGWVRHVRVPPDTGGGGNNGGGGGNTTGGGGNNTGGGQQTPSPAPPDAGRPPAPPAGPRDLRPPRLSAFTVSRNVMALGAKEGKIVGRIGDEVASGRKLRAVLRVGNRLRWTADEAGTAFLTIAHTGCYTFSYVGQSVKPAERCPRKKEGVVYTTTVPSKLGGNTLSYRGATNARKHLRIGGAYRATLLVVDAAGNSSVSRSATFRVDELAKKR